MWLSSSSTTRVGNGQPLQGSASLAWDHYQLGWCPVHAGPSLYQCGDPSSGAALWPIWGQPYQPIPKKFKLGEATEPLPHLFLISDEFAELKVNQPDFIKKLVSIARVGRSLGALILADAKPSGVVDDQIWSNSLQASPQGSRPWRLHGDAADSRCG